MSQNCLFTTIEFDVGKESFNDGLIIDLMREKDVNYFENTFVNKVICQENSCIKRTFHFKVNFEHQSTTFQRKTRKIGRNIEPAVLCGHYQKCYFTA